MRAVISSEVKRIVRCVTSNTYARQEVILLNLANAEIKRVYIRVDGEINRVRRK